MCSRSRTIIRIRARTIKTFATLLLVIGLTGCTSALWNRYPPPSPTQAGLLTGAASGAVIGGIAAGGVGAGIGSIMGGVIGASFGNILASHYTMVDKLQYSGVQVIQVGDEIKLILPSDRFFTLHSSQLNIHYYPVLARVAQFLSQFQKISIKIAGYTDNGSTWRRDLALSRAQARHIMIYLWSYGVESRLIYAQGYGAVNPMASNMTAKGRRFNRRIEITLRKIID